MGIQSTPNDFFPKFINLVYIISIKIIYFDSVWIQSNNLEVDKVIQETQSVNVNSVSVKRILQLLKWIRY